ncbi:hypothetical protein G7046_g4734 [Stylonectria norvegica]|nr:hypothetical protein G7046_g4734 [Stylonectria norvegica]
MFAYSAYKKHKQGKADKEAAQQTDPEFVQDQQASAKSQTLAKDKHEKHHDHQKHDQRRSHSDSDRERSSAIHRKPVNPVLDQDDEAWLQRILNDDSPTPPLPPRSKTPSLYISDSEDAAEKQKKHPKEKKDKHDKHGKDQKQPGRLSSFFSKNKKHDSLTPDDAVQPKEAEREENDLSSVLDRMNLAAKNNKVVSLSNESSELLQRFTQIFKDLVNGVPTAYGDLTGLIEDRDGAINKGFEKLPSSLKKLVTQLPDKLTASLAPEILAAAAESQGLRANMEGGMKGAAKGLMSPQNLKDLVTKPGAVVSMLKAIVNALKARWPAFMGTNVLWSVALFLLMFVLWYCYKRGREVRLEGEKSASPIDGSDRIEELSDQPLLPAPEAAVPLFPEREQEREQERRPVPAGAANLPPPPVGPDARQESSRN